jgi:hypothetical protein
MSNKEPQNVEGKKNPAFSQRFWTEESGFRQLVEQHILDQGNQLGAR